MPQPQGRSRTSVQPPTTPQRISGSLEVHHSSSLTPRDEGQLPKVSVCYQGDPFSGKTTYALTWPGALFIQADSNTATLETAPVDVPTIVPRDGDQLLNGICQMIAKRNCSRVANEFPGFEGYKVQTVVVDSITSINNGHQFLWSGGPGSFKDPRQFWALHRTLLHKLIKTCCDATRPMGDEETYNFVCISHEKIHTNAEGNIIDITPSVDGAFKSDMRQYFDTWLLTEKRTKFSRTVEDGKPVESQDVEFRCHTVDMDRYRKAADRIGGHGKRFNKLPPIVDGTYQGLCKAWGVDGEEATQPTTT